MKIVLVADVFPPIRTSGAVQLRDLALEFVNQQHDVTVIIPYNNQRESWRLEDFFGVKICYLKAPKTKDVSFIWRALSEMVMPFMMIRNLKRSPIALNNYDLVVWYSPSIFFGPLVWLFKKCNLTKKGYLVVRDVFPEWALEMGLISYGVPYIFFRLVAQFQYSLADVIGVQSSGNLKYFDSWLRSKPGRRLEVLNNWLGLPRNNISSIILNKTSLTGRFVFVYAGNMGVAQGLDVVLELVERMCHRVNIGFLFVGRGSEATRIKQFAYLKRLDNVEVFDEISPDEIPDLYLQCSAGLVSLDSRHKSHNIPGKFISYMQSGLPVLANLNPGNDLIKIIKDEKVGQVCYTNNVDDLVILCDKLVDQVHTDPMLSLRCRAFFNREFAVENTVKQIVKAVSISNDPVQ